jgi:hypothetical protein
MNASEFDNLMANARAELDEVEGRNVEGKTKAEKMREAIKQVSARRRSPADFSGGEGAIPKTSGSNPDGQRTGPAVSERIDVDAESGFYDGVEETLERAGFELADTSDPGEFRKKLQQERDSKKHSGVGRAGVRG